MKGLEHLCPQSLKTISADRLQLKPDEIFPPVYSQTHPIHRWWPPAMPKTGKITLVEFLNCCSLLKKEKNSVKQSCQCSTHSAIQLLWFHLVIHGQYIIIAKLSNNVEIVFEQAPFRVECC